MTGTMIVLADTTAHYLSRAGEADGILTVWLGDGTGMAQAFAEFSDPEKTGLILFRYGDMGNEYSGYTHLICVQETGKEIAISLKQEADNADT